MKSYIKPLIPPVLMDAYRGLKRAVSKEQDFEFGVQQDREFYDHIWRTGSELDIHYADSQYFALWSVLIERMQPSSLQHVFDVGCGPGNFCAYLRDSGLRRLTGIDFSKVCIEKAKARCPEFEFYCEDALTTDLFDTIEYDAVITTEFLEHINQDLELLHRIKPRTRVFATVPNFPSTGHVRFFKHAGDVESRYSEVLTSICVTKLLFGSSGMRFFIIDGVR